MWCVRLSHKLAGWQQQQQKQRVGWTFCGWINYRIYFMLFAVFYRSSTYELDTLIHLSKAKLKLQMSLWRFLRKTVEIFEATWSLSRATMTEESEKFFVFFFSVFRDFEIKNHKKCSEVFRDICRVVELFVPFNATIIPALEHSYVARSVAMSWN